MAKADPIRTSRREARPLGTSPITDAETAVLAAIPQKGGTTLAQLTRRTISMPLDLRAYAIDLLAHRGLIVVECRSGGIGRPHTHLRHAARAAPPTPKDGLSAAAVAVLAVIRKHKAGVTPRRLKFETPDVNDEERDEAVSMLITLGLVHEERVKSEHSSASLILLPTKEPA